VGQVEKYGQNAATIVVQTVDKLNKWWVAVLDTIIALSWRSC
jgi:hypothetical protein